VPEALRYREGDWFAVPLRGGGFAVGLVARMGPRGKILLGYFFGPARATPPALGDVAALSPADAVLTARFGDLSLFRGEWPVLGSLPGWQAAAWPLPAFQRIDSLRGYADRIRYAEDDPAREVACEPLDAPHADLEPDRLMGAGAVEIALTKRLRERP
jgi:hypothetical protein